MYSITENKEKIKKKKLEITKWERSYLYTDENGNPLYQVWRAFLDSGEKKFIPKRYENGEFITGMGNTRHVLYNLPEVMKAVSEKRPVFIVEGEKDCQTLSSLGFTSTTNALGSTQKWLDSYNETLKKARVYLIPDNDAPGREHVKKIIKTLKKSASSLKVIDLNKFTENFKEKGDITDFLGLKCSTKTEAIETVENLMKQAQDHTKWGVPEVDFEKACQEDLKERFENTGFLARNNCIYSIVPKYGGKIE
jgi:5S rRNA maturation endonuclease (ribonuclease M5)